jgi:hypothetical protein
MKNLVLHIGLPKTGSTALQKSIFPFMSSKYLYAGKYYSPNPLNKLSVGLMKLLESPPNRREQSFKGLMRLLNNRDEENFIFSDEMILVDTPKSTWQEKLSTLGWLASRNDINVERIVLVIREPFKALFSWYVEVYNLIKQSHPTVLSYVERDNQALIYNYEVLLDEILKSTPPQLITILSLEELIGQGGLGTLPRLIGVTDDESTLQAPIINKKNTLGADYISNRKNLREAISSIKLVQLLLSFFPRKSYAWLANLTTRISIGKQTIVTHPSDEDTSIIRKKLSFNQSALYAKLTDQIK